MFAIFPLIETEYMSNPSEYKRLVKVTDTERHEKIQQPITTISWRAIPYISFSVIEAELWNTPGLCISFTHSFRGEGSSDFFLGIWMRIKQSVPKQLFLYRMRQPTSVPVSCTCV